MVPPDTARRRFFPAFNRARFDVGARACYCSVLDDRWVRTEHGAEPTLVESCAAERAQPQYR